MRYFPEKQGKGQQRGKNPNLSYAIIGDSTYPDRYRKAWPLILRKKYKNNTVHAICWFDGTLLQYMITIKTLPQKLTSSSGSILEMHDAHLFPSWPYIPPSTSGEPSASTISRWAHHPSQPDMMYNLQRISKTQRPGKWCRTGDGGWLKYYSATGSNVC